MAVHLGLLVCVSWQAGCGASGPPTGSVSGKVTYKGQPLTTGVVTFLNEKTGSGASGDLDGSGRYHIVLVRTGEYKVAVYRRPPAPGERIVGSARLSIPEKYQAPETSGLTATVKEGENTADFAL
jgi:hypothetical protein